MSDTKQRIQQAARDLFAKQGVRKTSLREIAEELGISKPALYYHFSSREDLVRSIVEPILTDAGKVLAKIEARPDVDHRTMLEEYFDFHYAYRRDLLLFLSEASTLTDLGMIELVLAWRRRFAELLVGTKPTLAMAARATVALGGVQDCAIEFPDEPQAELRAAAVDAAMAALGKTETGS